MHRPNHQQQQQRQGRPQHLPHCKYYQGEPPANAAVFDVRSRQDEAEAEARRSRLQLQRLPALTIRRQLQVQWGPTVSLPQPGESPPPGPPPGHNVRLFEVRHGDARPAASAHSAETAPTFGQTFVVQKQGETHIQRQSSPLTRPLKPVDVSPLRELPPKQPPTQALPQPSPPVPPSTTPLSPSPSQRRSPPHQQTSRVKTSSRGKSSRHATTEMTRGRPLAVTITSARHLPSHGSRGAAGSKLVPTSAARGRTRAAARSPPRRSSARRGSPTRRRSPTRRVSPGAGAGTAAARRCDFAPSVSAPGRDAAATTIRAPHRAPARVDVTVTSLPPSVPGGLSPDGHSDTVFRELSATAEARRIASKPTKVADDSGDGLLGAEHEASFFGGVSVADMERPGLEDRLDTEVEAEADADEDLWSTARRIRRQQEVTDIEHRVLDLIGARVVEGLLNMDRKLEKDKWRDHHMQQPFLSNEVDEVGEHRVLGEGISMEETEIRTPINYDDYLDQEPADNEVGYKGSDKGGSANGGSLEYEDDFEEEEEDDEEEEANSRQVPPGVGDSKEKEQDQKSTSVPVIHVDRESPSDDKSGPGNPEVEATGDRPPPSPEPAAPSPPSLTHAPPSPGRFGTVRIRSRRTGGVTTVNLPLHLPIPTPVSSPERSWPGPTHRVVTPERSPSPRSGEGGRVPTPPPSPEHVRERVTMYRWRSRIEAPPAPALTPPVSPPPAPLGAFSFTPEGPSPRSSPPLPTPASAGAVASDTPADPLRVDTGRQTSGEVRAGTEAPVVPARYGRVLGTSLTSSSSLAYSSSLSSNPQVQSQDSLSWGEVRPQRAASSSADTQLSQGEVPPGAAREAALLCSSLSEGEVVSRHRCSRAPSGIRQAEAVPGTSRATSTAGAAVGGTENGGTRKDLSEGEVSEGLVPVPIPYRMPDDTDSTSVSDTS